ncbi:hypothetical protein K8T06_11725 [bacterium]|nr:hypothetical protein [bacterium]
MMWKTAPKLMPVPDIQFVDQQNEDVFTSVTLDLDRFRVHLTCEKEIGLGRNKENRIVTRLYNSKGQSTHELNHKISRFHARICDAGDSFSVFDGVADSEGERPSAMGCYLDSKKIKFGQPTKIDRDLVSQLILAGNDSQNPGLFGLDMESWFCDQRMSEQCSLGCSSIKSAALILKRRDSIPEIFILVRNCIALGAIHESLRGLLIWTDKQGLFFKTTSKKGVLRPGLRIKVCRGIAKVTEWQQYYFSGADSNRPNLSKKNIWAVVKDWKEWIAESFRR